MTDTPKQKRGFACMSAEDRSRISSMGGHAVPNEKRAYSVNRTLAAAAGRKGGLNKGSAS